MKLIKESKWQQATDLRGNPMLVKTIWEANKKGKVYTRRIAIREKVA